VFSSGIVNKYDDDTDDDDAQHFFLVLNSEIPVVQLSLLTGQYDCCLSNNCSLLLNGDQLVSLAETFKQFYDFVNRYLITLLT